MVRPIHVFRNILLGRTDASRGGAAAVAGDAGGCPADIITLFTLKCIAKVGTQAVPDDVERATNFLLVCRLLYRTHEGLRVIGKHKIAVHLKRALKVPTVGALDGMTPWDHALVDSLLNLASTPKGMQALQHAGTPLVRQCTATSTLGLTVFHAVPQRYATRAVCDALLSVHAHRVLIGACHLMMCPIRAVRRGTPLPAVPAEAPGQQVREIRIRGAGDAIRDH